LLNRHQFDVSVALSNQEVYDIILTLGSMEPLKANILLILAHIAPDTVSGTELTQLLGYSTKARTIYRGVLTELENDGYIRLHRDGNQHAITIDQSHSLMIKLHELVVEEGSDYTDRLYTKLGEL